MVLKRPSLKWHILLVCTALVVLPTILFLIIYAKTYSEDLTNHIIKEKHSILRQMNKNIYNQFSTYENLTMMLYHNDVIKDYIDSGLLSSEAQAAVYQYLSGLVNSEKYLTGAVLQIGSHLYTAGHKYENLDDYFAKHSEQVLEGKGRPIWIPTEKMATSYQQGVRIFALARAVNAPDRTTGTLWLFLSEDFFYDIFESMGDLSSTGVLTPEGLVVADDGQKQFESVARQPYIKDVFSRKDGYLIGKDVQMGTQDIVVFSASPQTGWCIVTAVPHGELLKGVEHIRTLACAMALVYLLFILLTYAWLSNMIFDPLAALSNAIKKVSAGEFLFRLEKKKNNEIGQLMDSYNYMAEKIDSLLAEVRNEEKAKNDEKIKALSMQIGPHFIYNTLNTIKWMASINKQTNIKRMVESLIRLMGCVTYNTNELVSLREELDLVRCYGYIQQSRYMNFELVYNIPPEAESCLVNKLILQPIVENSILYGFAQELTPGTITISAQVEEDLIILIEDTGKGFDTAILKMPRKGHQEKPDHIGIQNVIERIRLNYGEKYGVTVESTVGVGTRVVYRLPVMRREEDPS